MKKASLLILLLATALLPARLSAKNGVLVNLKTADGRQISGELIATRGRSLLISDDSGISASASVGEIRELSVRNQGKFGKGAWPGLLVGAVAGALIAANLPDPSPTTIMISIGQRSAPLTFGNALEKAFRPITGGTLGGGAGFLVGGLISKNINGPKKTISFDGKTGPEIDAILEDLRLRSKFPDYSR